MGCFERLMSELYPVDEEKFRQFDPAVYACRIWDAYAAGAIDEAMTDDLLDALDRNVVRSLCSRTTNGRPIRIIWRGLRPAWMPCAHFI